MGIYKQRRAFSHLLPPHFNHSPPTDFTDIVVAMASTMCALPFPDQTWVAGVVQFPATHLFFLMFHGTRHDFSGVIYRLGVSYRHYFLSFLG